MNKAQTSYTVNLDFESIKLPPVTDILVLAKKAPQGKVGILEAFELILPDVFELVEIKDDRYDSIDAIIVNKAISAKIPVDDIVAILREHVFPFVMRGETIKVNFDVHIFHKGITREVLNENKGADKSP